VVDPGDVDPNFMVIDNNDSSTGSMSIYGGGAESGPSNSRSNGGSNIGTGNGSGPARGLGSDFRGLGGERFNNSKILIFSKDHPIYDSDRSIR